MFGTHFYNETIKRAVSIFGTLFNNIKVKKTKADGTVLTEQLVPISYGIQAAYEFNLNPYDRRFLPRYSYLYAYSSVRRDSESINIFSSQEFQLGEFSVGINQQFGLFENFSFLNLGLSAGLTYENFDFGVSYAFSIQDLTNTYRYPPRIFDLYLSFDFSPFLRNRRGQYKRLQVDNY